MTIWSAEQCKWCQGTGRLGRIGNIILVCETCGGGGGMLIERGRIIA